MSKLADALSAHGVSVQGSGKDASLVMKGSSTEAPAPTKAEAPAPPPPPEKTLPASTSQSTAQAPDVASNIVFIGCAPAWTRPVHIDEAFAHYYTEAETRLGIPYWLSDKYGEGVKLVLASLGALAASRKQSGEAIIQTDLFVPRDHPLAPGLCSLLRRYGHNRIVQG
jgi:hypothetical protein